MSTAFAMLLQFLENKLPILFYKLSILQFFRKIQIPISIILYELNLENVGRGQLILVLVSTYLIVVFQYLMG